MQQIELRQWMSWPKLHEEWPGDKGWFAVEKSLAFAVKHSQYFRLLTVYSFPFYYYTFCICCFCCFCGNTFCSCCFCTWWRAAGSAILVMLFYVNVPSFVSIFMTLVLFLLFFSNLFLRAHLPRFYLHAWSDLFRLHIPSSVFALCFPLTFFPHFYCWPSLLFSCLHAYLANIFPLFHVF